MEVYEKYGITSLAAPTERDLEIIEEMGPEAYAAMLREHLEFRAKDAEAGNYIELNSEEEIRAYFAGKRAKYESPTFKAS